KEPVPAPLFQVVATLRSSAADAGAAPDLQLMAFGPYDSSGVSPGTFLGAAGHARGGAERNNRDERREWMRRTCWTYHHPVGTCSMGPASDPFAVVDDRGRVHGIDGLRVADASVMPDVPSAN